MSLNLRKSESNTVSSCQMQGDFLRHPVRKNKAAKHTRCYLTGCTRHLWFLGIGRGGHPKNAKTWKQPRAHSPKLMNVSPGAASLCVCSSAPMQTCACMGVRVCVHWGDALIGPAPSEYGPSAFIFINLCRFFGLFSKEL